MRIIHNDEVTEQHTDLFNQVNTNVLVCWRTLLLLHLYEKLHFMEL